MSSSMRARLFAIGFVAFAFAFAFALAACDKPEHRISNYPVLVRAYDDVGKPLQGLSVVARGRDLGTTEATGEKLFTLQGTEGQRVDLSATCPVGYDGPRERPLLLLKRLQSLEQQGVQPIELNLTCDAKQHLAMVAIRTGKPGIPVLLRGQVVAQTSSSGTAHVFLKEDVGNAFQLQLDTQQKQELRPESPERIFNISQRDSFTIWDQPFEEEKKKPVLPPKRVWKKKPRVDAPPPPPPPPPKIIPTRLGEAR
jgi:hypothetical protein